jgi:HEAT repeat protein
MRSFLLALLVLGPWGSAPACLADLDVAVPPGTPLEWIRELSRPTPTGHRGRVPVPSGYGELNAEGARPGTQAEDRYPKGPVKAPWRPSLEYTVVSAADIFGVTSADCPGHLKWGTPPPTKPVVTQDDVATEGGFVIRWNYPPNFPAELIWVGVLAALRERIHTAAISWAEAAAYCLEVGEPALLGVAMGDGKIRNYLAGTSTKLPPKPPDTPKPKNPQAAGLFNLAAVELSGGFPHALDPTFARRTLALGDEMYDAVLECCRSAHPHLARNAVLVLAGYPQSTPDLIKLWRESRDRTFRMRALRALSERGEKSIVKDVEAELFPSDLPVMAMALYALGRIGDASVEATVLELLRKNPKKPMAADNVDWSRTEVLWSAIPALGRMKAGRDVLLGMEAYLRKRCGGRDDADRDNPQPEKLFRQMCLIALAHHGEKAYLDEVVKRVKDKGLDAFHRATHYALIDALAASDEGAEAMKSKPPTDRHVRLALVETLSKSRRITAVELEQIALRAAEAPPVRARAVQLLLDHDGPTARSVCQKLLGEFVKGKAVIDPGAAQVAQAAAQVGGIVDAVGPQVLIDAVKRAFEHGCFARREGNNETDLTRARIVLFPALLETLVIELGRTRASEAFPILRQVFAKRAFPQGRAEAVVAIGAIPGKEADETLIDALADKDGWVRYCASRALVKRSGEDHFSGWIWMDNPAAARKAIGAYKEWWKKRYPE